MHMPQTTRRLWEEKGGEEMRKQGGSGGEKDARVRKYLVYAYVCVTVSNVSGRTL